MAYIHRMQSSATSASRDRSQCADAPVGARPPAHVWRPSSLSTVPQGSLPETTFGVEEAKKLDEAKASQAEADRVRMELAAKSRQQKHAKESKGTDAAAPTKAAASKGKQPAAKHSAAAAEQSAAAAAKVPPAAVKRRAPADKTSTKRGRVESDESDLDYLFSSSSSPIPSPANKPSTASSSSKAAGPSTRGTNAAVPAAIVEGVCIMLHQQTAAPLALV